MIAILIAGGWRCSTGNITEDQNNNGSNGDNNGGNDNAGNNDNQEQNGSCEATGNNLNTAKSRFESRCGIRYNKSRGHDCDPHNGGWRCSTKNL